ncbi:MAG: malate synthase A [Myxococcota bacterium]
MSDTKLQLPDGVEVTGEVTDAYAEILTEDAVAFIATLHREFNTRRIQLLQKRSERDQEIQNGEMPGFLESTKDIREGDWKVGPIPEDLQNRNVEITGPVDRKMVINALNSGADVFMADFEDSNSPTWDNCVGGQINLRDAVRGDITFVHPTKDKTYELGDDIATLLVRPRGWHLVEKHVAVDGEPISASLFDFGLYFYHNARALLDNGSGPYFYLPKLESHLEARLWNDVFIHAQDELGIPQGTIKATVLIETILGAFEMEEILYEIKEHAAGHNAGRWDYIFSVIKKFRSHDDFLLPDRSDVTMGVPFMKSYAENLVRVCHKRGAHAIGGMAAFIPSKDEEANERAFREVKADKEREARQGYDGTWVAHPGLVPVAREAFENVLEGRPHQKDELREDVDVTAEDLLNTEIEGGEITEDGLRLNINVGIQYIASWMGGQGAAAIYNLMEDAATAEISRSQVWQWIQHPDARLSDGREVTKELYQELVPQEMEKIQDLYGDHYDPERFELARELFDRLSLDDNFVEFLTLIAYDYLD